MQRRWRLLIVAAIFVMVLAACGDKTETKTANTDNQPSNEKVETVDTQPTKEPAQPDQTEEKDSDEPTYKYVYPLTGEPTNEPVDNRIVAVMINNFTPARPQTGLNDADLVYEVLAEGPITRFVAFFQSKQPKIVGPVRSAREYFINLANGYHAIYVYHGAAQYIEDHLKQGWIDHLNGMYYDDDHHLFQRADFRVAPHNSYLIFKGVYDDAKKKGYEVTYQHKALPFLTKDEVKNIPGKDAESVKIVYSVTPMEMVTFVYQPDKEKYIRYNDGKQTVDLETNEPLQVDNIFIFETKHKVIDSKLRRAIDLESGGKGYLLQKGKVQEVEWKNVDGRILPFKDGKALGFVPGKTWVNIVPKSPGLKESVSFDVQSY